MIPKTSWQPKGLHWEIRMHLALPWKREQPEALHCPHPSSNEAASKCFQPCWGIVLLAEPAAEEPGFQGGASARLEAEGNPQGDLLKAHLDWERAGWLAGPALLTGSCPEMAADHV